MRSSAASPRSRPSRGRSLSPAASLRAGPTSLSAAARAACNTGPTTVGSGVRPSACVPRTDHVPTRDPGRVRSKSHVLFKGRVPRKSGVCREGNDAFAVRAHDAFLGEEPRVDVAAAVRTFSDEVLLLHRILRDELIARPVDGAFDQAFIKRLAEELLRLEPRLPEPLRHDVHLDSPLGLRPARELDDGPLATPLSYADCDRDYARNDRDRAAQVQEERDVVQQDDEEEAEEQGEAAHREVRDWVEVEKARCARGHVPSDGAAVLQSGDVRITETHGDELAARGRRGSLYTGEGWRELRGFADEEQARARDADQAEGNHREREGPECAREGTSENRADDEP